MENNHPCVTIISVTLNNSDALETTIKSIINQTYPNIEYIIIDGGSSDNTSSIIQKFTNKISLYVSEADKGIYDAMNKGVQLSTGEWVIFMNAGDSFNNKNVINNIFKSPRHQTDIVYGNHKIIYEDRFEGTHSAGEIHNLWKGMIFSHQAVFIRQKLLKKHIFSLSEPIGADFKMILEAYLDGATFKKENIVISKVLNKGLSDKERIQSILSHWRTTKKHINTFRVSSYYLCKIINMIFRQLAKSILPSKLISKIVKSKYN